MKKITTLIILAIAANFCWAQTPALFGTCYSGGSAGYGTIFKTDLNGNNLQTVYSFLNPEGAMPWGKIAQAPNGKIYGVTFLGGCSDSCTLYEYDPITNSCTDVYDFFCNTPISEPSQNGLIILPDGNIYGLEQSGIIYRFDPNTHVYTLLNQSSMAYYGGLMQGSDGALYGVSYTGGANNAGCIFRYDLASNTYSILYSFISDSGGSPYMENLIQGTNGKLYGTTHNGGANNSGVIFSYDLATNTYNDLYDFGGLHGAYPMSGVMQAADGKLYGMTSQGGQNTFGVIFRYDIATSQYSVLYDFNTSMGTSPQRTLTQGSNGKLFGTTYSGGAYSMGVAFSYDLATSTYTKLIDFSTAIGTNPQSDFQEGTWPIEEGIAAVNNSSNSIYVNSSNHLVVRNQGLTGSGEISIFDGLGKNVFQSTIENRNSEFDLSSYSNGIYFVQLKSNEKLTTQKIVLSR